MTAPAASRSSKLPTPDRERQGRGFTRAGPPRRRQAGTSATEPGGVAPTSRFEPHIPLDDTSLMRSRLFIARRPQPEKLRRRLVDGSASRESRELDSPQRPRHHLSRAQELRLDPARGLLGFFRRSPQQNARQQGARHEAGTAGQVSRPPSWPPIQDFGQTSTRPSTDGRSGLQAGKSGRVHRRVLLAWLP